MFCFVTGLCCHYSQLHLNLRTQITLARIQVLQQHFQCHSQYYSRLTVCVCKHTDELCTATSVLLQLGVLQCCDQHGVPGVPHHIPYRAWIRGTYQNSRGNVKTRKIIRLLRPYDIFFANSSDPVDSAILKDAVQCPDESRCFAWVAVYHNISALIKN
jgi:hypothetical protein